MGGLAKVLSKSFKIVPIMVMGKILGNKGYPFYDYVVAGVIALGITLFLVRAPKERTTEKGTGE